MMQTLDLDLTIKPRVNYSESCLPKTLKLATKHRYAIIPCLSDIDSQLSFQDKILVWLIPSFNDDVRKFYYSDGKQMLDIYDQYQSDLIDKSLVTLLEQKLHYLVQ